MNNADFILLKPLPPENLLNDLIESTRRLTWNRAAEWMDLPPSTLRRRFENLKELLILQCRLFERTLSRPKFISRYCRHLPVFAHPVLAHEPFMISALEKVSRKKVGLTFIVSESTLSRMFVAYALGHEIANQNQRVFGLSSHGDDVLVPFENLDHLQGLSTVQTNAACESFSKTATRTVSTPVILMDLTHLHRTVVKAIQKRSTHRHLIICDTREAIEKLKSETDTQVHVVHAMSRTRSTLNVEIKLLTANLRRTETRPKIGGRSRS